MEISVYFVSKPIQYFNVTNIEDSNRKILFVIDGFNNAKALFQKAQALQSWDEVRFFDDFSKAFQGLQEFNWHRLYLDSDYGYSKHKFLRNYAEKEIFVFEEGLGTYTNNLRKVTEKNLKLESIPQKLRSFFLTLFYGLVGNKDYLGGNKFTRGVFVYDKARHHENFPKFDKEIKSFKASFVEHLRRDDVRAVLYGESYVIDKVKTLLYISSWIYNPKVEPFLEQYKGYKKLIKPHPHLKGIPDSVKEKFDDVIKGEYLVEYLIDDLLRQCDELVIIHEGSAALLYFDPVSFKEILI